MSIRFSKDLLKTEYLINKLNSYEIGRKYNCTAVWVNILRKRYNIRTLKPYERNRRQKLSKRQREYIYGTLLGDGCIQADKYRPNKNAFLRIYQSKSHIKYIEFQYSIMKDFTKKGIHYEKRAGRKDMCCFRTISHPIFTKIYKEIYPNGLKSISSHWLNQLTSFSLAFWYMDDGSITQSHHQMRISTESFDYREHLLIQKYFRERWGILVDIKPSPKQGKFLLSFKASERNKFLNLIERYIISDMKYKLYSNG